MESGAYCDFNLHTVYQLDRDITVDACVLNHYGKMQFCCNCLTLSERKILTSTSPLETEIMFNLLSVTAYPGVGALS